MFDESPRKIQPIWLFGGGVVLGLFLLCAMISLVTAGVVIWLSVSRASNAERATDAAVVELQTESPVTDAVPSGVAPTPLPAFGTVPLQPTSLPLPTQIAVPALAPDQAVRSYYQLVSQQRYDITWAMLTDTFKQKFNCCAPNYNYTDYVNWWNSVNYVDFGDVRTVSQSGDRAVVYAEVYFVMNTGARSSVDRDPYIALVYDPAMGNWRFDDKRAFP
jgi:hypothetical protein